MNTPTNLAALMLLFVGVLSVGLDAPFVRHHESVGAVYATMARNHVRAGLGVTWGANLEVASPDLAVYGGEWGRYVYPNRPPLSVLLTAGWFAAFGMSEVVLRLSLMAAALGALLAFHALAVRLARPREVLLATGIFAFMPLYWYFSIVAVHLVYALTFSLVAWACHVRRADGPRWRRAALFFLVLACLSDWPGYYAALGLALDALCKKERRIAVNLSAAAAVALALHVGHLAWVGGGDLVARFVSAGVQRAAPPNPVDYAVSEGRELALYATLGVLLLAVRGACGLPSTAWWLALLGLDEILFARLAFQHDYMTYPLTPFLALAAARGAVSMGAGKAGRLVAAGLLLAAAVQTALVTGDRLSRAGAQELEVRGGQAIRKVVGERERALVVFAHMRQSMPWYADRWTIGAEASEDRLMVHPSGGGEPVGDWRRHFGTVDWVVFGDPDQVASEIEFFKGRRPAEAFRLHGPDHPLRRDAAARAMAVVHEGPFVFYRMR